MTLEKHWEIRQMIVSATCMSLMILKRTWVFLISTLSVLLEVFMRSLQRSWQLEFEMYVLNFIISSNTISSLY